MLQVFTTKAALSDYICNCKAENKKIGFVPTMGALHQGHISLIEQAKKENDIVIASVFVNPTQFNDKSDLEKYPRTPEEDIKMLEEGGCNAVFMPLQEEMYPAGEVNESYNFGNLESVMEGKFRPGHFNGVAIIVKRLLNVVKPHNAYFGQKDFQQLAIVRALVKMENLPVNIIGCPIIREIDGLAMSSRNRRLSAKEREESVKISKALAKAKNEFALKTIDEIRQDVLALTTNSFLKPEYFEIVNPNTLESITDKNSCPHPVGCIAVWAGNVRLIDNIQF